MLYMFQAVPPPIIRSSKLYIQHRVLCQTFTATCHCRGRDGNYEWNYELMKFISAKQAKETYKYRNIKRKLYKANAAVW